MKITRFEDLQAWQEARNLVKMAYRVTTAQPFRHDFSLRDQIRRAAVSAMSNIAEGFVRRSNREFIQFLFISISSIAEVQSHLYVSLDQRYISQEEFNQIYEQADKTAKIISGFIRYLRTKQTRQTL
jgi:four helix bundle protein